jgi:hypothetical protein
MLSAVARILCTLWKSSYTLMDENVVGKALNI